MPGALILLGGDPGIGKSTILLQVSGKIADTHGKVLYASGEESQMQLKLRAERLGIQGQNLAVMADTNLDSILQEASQHKPSLLVIDSIQTMFTDALDSTPGSVGQVRECTARLLRFAKEQGVPVIIIGHVTKEGNIAGPRMLEHMVDVVLYFEGERSYQFRILRGIKNRFGSTSESGLFVMEEEGLAELLIHRRPYWRNGRKKKQVPLLWPIWKGFDRFSLKCKASWQRPLSVCRAVRPLVMI